MKEKEETAINPTDILEQAATDYYNKWRFVGGTVIKPAFLDGANFMSTQMYTREQVEKMLSALRQRCAEENRIIYHNGHTKADIELTYFQSGADNIQPCNDRINSIDVHQFIPPLKDK